MTPPQPWHILNLTLPKELVSRVERAVDQQSRRENRVVSLSEFVCWRLTDSLDRWDEEVRDEG